MPPQRRTRPQPRGERRCHKCKQEATQKTIRRHKRYGCPTGQRPTRFRQDAEAILEEVENRPLTPALTVPPTPSPTPPPTPPPDSRSPPSSPCSPRGRRPYARRYPPQGRPPLVSPPPPPPGPGPNWDRNRKRKFSRRRSRSRSQSRDDRMDVDDDYRFRHPDFHLDTPGAGPSSGALPSINEKLAALYEQQPWLKGLTGDQISRMRTQEDIARKGGFKLSLEDKLLAQAFNYKVYTDITGKAFDLLPHAFPQFHLPKPSEYDTRVAKLSGIKGTRIDCCINSCVAYTGPYRKSKDCPSCGEARYKIKRHQGRPNQRVARRHFLYIPLIPRLVNMYRDPATAKLLGYRADREPRADTVSDIFDGSHYNKLRGRCVTVRGRPLDHQYFSSPTDIALGLSTDGFGPFRKDRQTCWPLLVFNYNLSPAIRHRLENLLCLGVVPGPTSPKEIDTFLAPLVDELEELARGVPAFDGQHMRPFCLRAYLLTCFGDMPAVAKLMCMKGVNGKHPCRACKIIGIRGANTKTHYTPLSRPFATDNEGPRSYDPYNLPRRTHAEFLRDALHVEKAKTNAAENRRSRRTGINGLSALVRVSSLDFPGSFPHDFMHVMFENVLPTLIKIWTRTHKFSTFGTTDEGWYLKPSVWSAIGKACEKSGNTIPSRFGCRVPNLAGKKTHVTSEMMFLFATLLAPGLLFRRFDDDVYYRHFISLVTLISKCCQLEYSRDDVQFIREGFAKWVRKYEELYYKKSRNRLRACTLPVHALLHIADDIETAGPIWCYWAFPMERYCGSLSRASISMRFPYASLDRRVRQIAQLAQIKNIYGLREELRLDPQRTTIVEGTVYAGQPRLVFAHPRRDNVLNVSTKQKVAAFIGAHLEIHPTVVSRVIERRPFVLWGRMQQIDHNGGGDLVRGRAFSPPSERATRDASYVKYETLLGRYQWNRLGPQVLREPVSGYARVEHFIVIDTNCLQDIIEAAGRLIPLPEPLLLALVSPIPFLKSVREFGANLVQYRLAANGTLARSEIIAASDIECLVGRFTVPDPHKASYIVDRETIVGRVDMLEEMAQRD
ncbi:Transposase family Tnp2 protein [Ceratobasidium sp. AG-Ba]|nr:Transposase family Tnp2 protein [Ceratobasidium sp. AG-Ba]